MNRDEHLSAQVSANAHAAKSAEEALADRVEALEAAVAELAGGDDLAWAPGEIYLGQPTCEAAGYRIATWSRLSWRLSGNGISERIGDVATLKRIAQNHFSVARASLRCVK